MPPKEKLRMLASHEATIDVYKRQPKNMARLAIRPVMVSIVKEMLNTRLAPV